MTAVLLARDLNGAEVGGVTREDLGDGIGEDRVAVDVEELAEAEHRRADLPPIGHAAGDQAVDPGAHGTQAIAAAQIATEPAAFDERGAVGRILDHLLAAERAGVTGDLTIAVE